MIGKRLLRIYMQFKFKKVLIDKGNFSSSKEWTKIEKQIEQAILKIENPKGAKAFYLYDEKGKGRGCGNGVKPIKIECMKQLKKVGWELEKTIDIATLKRPGDIDATKKVKDKYFAFEWETGNISSSHRALNKLALGILKGILVGGVLVLPTRKMYTYLTDRVGNYSEIEPYFPLWESLPVKEGFLMIVAIEHDGVSKNVPRIPKGTDGRAVI